MGSTDTEINWTKEHQHQPTSSEQTLAQRREHPYIWATWLPRLLTGENSCEWQPGMYQRAYRLCTTGTAPVCSPEVKSAYRMVDVTYNPFTESTD